MGVKLKSLRPAVGIYGNVAANGIVEVDESAADRLRKTGRFVPASDADIKAAQKAQKDHISRAVTGTGMFAPIPDAPPVMAGSLDIPLGQLTDSMRRWETGAALKAGEVEQSVTPSEDAANVPEIVEPPADGGKAAEPTGETGKAADKAGEVEQTVTPSDAVANVPGIVEPPADGDKAAEPAAETGKADKAGDKPASKTK